MWKTAVKPKTVSGAVPRRVVPHAFNPKSGAQRDSVRSILRSTGAQAKLTIGQPNDKYEQEADRVADRVMRMSDADVAQRVETGTVQPMRIQRMCPECEEEMAQRQPMEEEEEMLQPKLMDESLQRQPIEEEEEELQAKEQTGLTPHVGSVVESCVNSLRSGGQPLDKNTRSFFEPRFGQDFSHVRIHNSGHTADVSRSINARAFTLGNNVVFGSNQYQPQSNEGKRLLGHELTHVVQQGVGLSKSQSNRVTASSIDVLQNPGRISRKVTASGDPRVTVKYTPKAKDKSSKIVFLQVMRELLDGVAVKPSKIVAGFAFQDADTTSDFYHVDYVSGEADPYYNGDDAADGVTQGDATSTPKVDADMKDKPNMSDASFPTGAKKVEWQFRTIAFSAAGADKGGYYEYARWHYVKEKGKASKIQHYGTSTNTSLPKSKKAINLWASNHGFVMPK